MMPIRAVGREEYKGSELPIEKSQWETRVGPREIVGFPTEGGVSGVFPTA